MYPANGARQGRGLALIAIAIDNTRCHRDRGGHLFAYLCLGLDTAGSERMQCGTRFTPGVAHVRM